jgi:hypothetical protein
MDATTKLGIARAVLNNPSMWMRQRTSQGIGGSSIDYVVSAQYALRRDDGSWVTHQEELAIVRPTSANRTLPSLLGWDILRHYRVVADWHANSVRLEDP